MRTNNLLKGKPESGFPGLAAVLLSFGLALAAAGGMVLAGCDSPAGVGNGNDEAVSGEASGIVLNSAGEGTTKKPIAVHFVPHGISNSNGIVSTQDDSYLVYDGSPTPADFTIAIKVPADDEYLNIRWKGFSAFFSTDIYLKAKMKAESDFIRLDYKAPENIDVATKNLYDVHIESKRKGNEAPELYYDWENAKKRAVKD